LQAEIQAYEARTDWFQQFVAQTVDRGRKPPFTL
jgi:hypothetical protein